MKRTELKRSSALKRTPLARTAPTRPGRRECDECGKEYQPVWTGIAWSKACSVSCVMAGRPAILPGELAGTHSPRRRAQVVTRLARARSDARRWRSGMAMACEVTSCTYCARQRSRLTQHHVIYVQRLRVLKADVWDPRNRMTVCNDAHMAHHKRASVILTLDLPDSAYAFARDVMGAGAAHEYLSRRYAGDDPRLDALDAEWRLAGDPAAH